MQHITPKNRQQYEFVDFEDFIDKNNPVRFVDAFVDKLEFAHPKCQSKINPLWRQGSPLTAGFSFCCWRAR